MLDDLRQSTQQSDFDDFDDDGGLDLDREAGESRLILGMTAAERMILSIFLFMNVSVLMIAFLLATKRVAF
jgi:hypothetical protein